MRCLPLILPSLPLKVFPYLAYIAACLIALAGPVAMAGYDDFYEILSTVVGTLL